MSAVYTDTLFTLHRDNTTPDDPARTYVRKIFFFYIFLTRLNRPERTEAAKQNENMGT